MKSSKSITKPKNTKRKVVIYRLVNDKPAPINKPKVVLNDHEQQVLDLVTVHVNSTSTPFDLPETLLIVAKSLVKKGLLFWCGDYTRVMSFKKAYE